MALVCGTTVDGCPGKTGQIRIEATKVEPAFVRSRYPGEAWREFKDPSQNLRAELNRVSQPAQPGQCPVRYRFFTRFRRSLTGAWTNVTRDMASNHSGPIVQLRLFLRSGDVAYPNQEIIFLTGPPPDRFVEGRAFFGEATLFATVRNSSTGLNQEISYGISSGLGRRDIVRAEYLGMARIDGQPDDCAPGEEECTLNVLGANNAIIYSEKRAVCPEVITVPEAYSQAVESFVVGGKPSTPLRIVNSEVSGRKSTTVFLGNTPVKKFDSPLGATLYPRVCWDCTEDEKCPPGTCSVDCGDRICCIDARGMPVKEIRK